MDRTSADSYVYAKACGMVARSWTGPRHLAGYVTAKALRQLTHYEATEAVSLSVGVQRREQVGDIPRKGCVA